MLVLPLLAVAIVPSPDLGSLAAFRKKAGAALAPTVEESTAPVEDPSFIDIEYAGQSERYARVTGVDEGRTVDLLGFVSKETGVSAQTFELTRFYISCCAADAIPQSVVVDPGDSATDLEQDARVRVAGELERRDGRLVVVATSLKGVDPPEQPYLY